MGEKSLELGVDHVEGNDQSLATLAVEVLDGAAQLADRLDDVVALLQEQSQPVG
ncbi:hypothetical protein D3C87_2016810 [compost metagenome]